ncbi:hypothetical protein RC62_1892 [Flavobacterium aquidurense]|uniref:Uncharacterized protein n=1 Tax=Flavobacterium aquidurense TaxID=362413 RepID=A0A0Q0XRE0_9FLAO|nr:hypothetical protein RC62_1892 [Flavobacterium aquidurense]
MCVIFNKKQNYRFIINPLKKLNSTFIYINKVKFDLKNQ